VRKSVAVVAVVGIVAAAIVAVVALWLPARQQRAAIAWNASGERVQVCANGGIERCFLGPGDPTAQVATVKAALANVATGPVQASCAPVPQQGEPDTCHLTVPVAGSRLIADIFAHPQDRSKPLSQWTYNGAYVLIHLDQH
jgi:hypothetical protein